MRCDSQGCNGNLHLTTFSGSPATECPECDYIQLIPDNMLEYVKDMVKDIRPVVSFRKEYRADYRESLDCDLYRHFKMMNNFAQFIEEHRILMSVPVTSNGRGEYNAKLPKGYYIK